MENTHIQFLLQKAAQAPALAGIYIKSVSICAVRDLACEPILTITWSMPDGSAAIDAPTLSLPGVEASVISRPSDTAIELARELASPGEIEDAIMGAAWSLGSWDLCRIEHAPRPPDADWREARHGITCSFGRNGYVICGQPLVTGDHAGDEVCEIAARDGYITWRFVPLALATKIARARWAGKDTTLQPDCIRIGSPGSYRGKWWHPTTPGTGNEHQYQLGRGNHSNRSKTSAERRAPRSRE